MLLSPLLELYAKQFPKPVIVMEDLIGIRDHFHKSKELNRRPHSLF
jgi:IS605 OrfB family transposase